MYYYQVRVHGPARLYLLKRNEQMKQQDNRYCVDQKQLNSITVSDSYPLLNISNTLDMLSGFKYFVVIDMVSGFHQIPLDEESQPKTAVPFNFEAHLKYTRVPLGIKNGASAYQCIITNILLGLNGRTGLSYLDDIIISAIQQKIMSIYNICKCIADSRKTIRIEKRKFVVLEVSYLGLIISSQISPEHKKFK